ncbi:MAG: PAS domain-containing protein [Gemmatimonadales bacterium]|jgi:two-component system sensor histidine kinase PilS (NtrC family)|nr:MAG: PAS domain-containing protein [Gemmatimonadales bacterium]
MTTPSRNRPDRALPEQRELLKWVFGPRMGLLVATLGLGFLQGNTGLRGILLGASITAMALALTAYGYWQVIHLRRVVGERFLLLQGLADIAIITLLVHFAGGPNTPAPGLYILVIAAYALLLPFTWGLAVALLVAVAYTTEGVWHAGAHPGLDLWSQIGVFLAAYLLVGALTARLRAESAERASLEGELRRVRLAADEILRNIRSGVVTVDDDGTLAFINPTAADLLQLDGQTLMGAPVLDTLKFRAPELWAAMVAALRHRRKISRGEGTVSLVDGRTFPIGLSTTTFERDSDGRPSVTAIFTDISDLKRLNELNLRTERLEAVAALSASLAHEIRNPLASIRSAVEQLARSVHADEDDRYLAQLVVRESDRLSRLLSEFLDFARVRATEFMPVDLQAVVLAAARLVREHPDCRPDIEVRVEGSRTVIDGDEDLLHRVVANLLLNAVQAAKQPMVIAVTTRSAVPAELPGGCTIEQPVCLEVRDDGPGIPEELRDRLFQPFVTGRMGGSGLGLAIVQRAVEAHRGVVLVESGPRLGTTFTIFFPARRGAEAAA